MVAPINPMCGVVIGKGPGGDVICPEKAVDYVTITTDDLPTAVVLVCPKHSKMLDEGKELMFTTDDPNEHFTVQFTKGETHATQ